MVLSIDFGIGDKAIDPVNLLALRIRIDEMKKRQQGVNRGWWLTSQIEEDQRGYYTALQRFSEGIIIRGKQLKTK